jgi:hypothetical protein
MGPLERGNRTVRPAEFAAAAARPACDYEAGSSVWIWAGMFVGVCAGLAVVVGVGHLGPVLPWHVRNTVLGAFAGVLLGPVLAVSSFLSMLILPFSLEGILGDGIWSRLARSLNERRLAPLFLPFVMYVVAPMALVAYGASRMKPNAPSMLVPAALGAVVLGVILGGIFGALAGRVRRSA